MERRTLKVSWEVYKRLQDIALEQNMSLQETTDLLISRGLDDAHEMSSESQPYVDVLQNYFPFENFESPENLREQLDRVYEVIEQYKARQAMFLCPVCGKPISWKPDDPLGKWLKQCVQQHRWKHGNC